MGSLGPTQHFDYSSSPKGKTYFLQKVTATRFPLCSKTTESKTVKAKNKLLHFIIIGS